MKKLIQSIIEYIRYGIKKDGLIDEVDENNFGSDIFSLSRTDIPNETFVVFEPTPQDQTDTDFCVGYSAAFAAEGTEKRLSSGAFVFAMCKRMQGTIHTFGTSILRMCKARVRYGIPKAELWKDRRGKRNYFANWNNIPMEVYQDAAKHKSETYFEVMTPRGWSRFDAIVATLWKNREKNTLVHTGKDRHAITVIGYSKERDSLICQDSYGTRTYEKGRRYINRNEARGLFTPYILVDIPRNLAELLIKYNGKAIKTKDSIECYKVVDGKKHHIKNEIVAFSHNIMINPSTKVLTVQKGELNTIPTGDPLKYEDGENSEIITRLLNMVGKKELINKD